MFIKIFNSVTILDKKTCNMLAFAFKNNSTSVFIFFFSYFKINNSLVKLDIFFLIFEVEFNSSFSMKIYFFILFVWFIFLITSHSNLVFILFFSFVFYKCKSKCTLKIRTPRSPLLFTFFFLVHSKNKGEKQKLFCN